MRGGGPWRTVGRQNVRGRGPWRIKCTAMVQKRTMRLKHDKIRVRMQRDCLYKTEGSDAILNWNNFKEES